ncbi:MAG: LysR family transcriptional regulator [Verrucomicrobia bacterium]|nr:LysR family transcriptional regulator [Verrucomicrobiota bacterium]
MELRHLRYFLAVGEASNFSKAAAQLRIAQPALSRQVHDLEHEIGVELLRRSPRGATFTAQGRVFLEQVRELLKLTDESVQKVKALVRGEYKDTRRIHVILYDKGHHDRGIIGRSGSHRRTQIVESGTRL